MLISHQRQGSLRSTCSTEVPERKDEQPRHLMGPRNDILGIYSALPPHPTAPRLTHIEPYIGDDFVSPRHDRLRVRRRFEPAVLAPTLTAGER